MIPVDVTISGLNDSSQAVKDVIESALKDMLYQVRLPYISGADLLRNKNNTLYSGRVQSVVTDALVNGNFFNQLTLIVNGNSVVSYEFDLGNIPYLRNLTYTV